MNEQQRFGRPPTAAVHVTLMHWPDNLWSLTLTSRVEGSDQWDRFTLADLSAADGLEAVIVELQRRML